MPNTIHAVLVRGDPTEVLGTVVEAVTIDVVNLMTRRGTRAMKGGTDQNMKPIVLKGIVSVGSGAEFDFLIINIIVFF